MSVRESFAIILSAFFYSLQNLNVKMLIPLYSIWTITLFRGLCSAIISIFLILIFNIRPVLGQQKRKLVIRGMLGSLAILFGFVSLEYIDLSLATILLSTSSVWMAVIASMYFTKEWHWFSNIGVLLILGGISMLTMDNMFKFNHLIGIGFAFLSSIFSAAANLTIRDIKEESSIIITLYAMSLCMIFCAPGFFMKLPLIYDSWRIFELMGTGIFSFIAQTLKNRALQSTENLGILLLRHLDILFSLLWDTLLYKRKFNRLEIVGITLVLIGCFTWKLKISFIRGISAESKDEGSREETMANIVERIDIISRS